MSSNVSREKGALMNTKGKGAVKIQRKEGATCIQGKGATNGTR